MRWFGESWGAPICETTQRHETPVGRQCAHECGKLIGSGDSGLLIPYLGPVEGKDLAGGGVPESLIVTIGYAPHLAYHLACFFDEIGVTESGIAKGN